MTVFRQSASTDDFLTKSFELAGATCGENVHEASPPSTGLTDVHFTPRYQVFASSLGFFCSREKQIRPLLIRIRWLLAEHAMHADPPSSRPTKRPVRTFATLPSNLIITRFLVPSTVPCGLLHSSTYSGGIAGRAGKASAKSTTQQKRLKKVRLFPRKRTRAAIAAINRSTARVTCTHMAHKARSILINHKDASEWKPQTPRKCQRLLTDRKSSG